MLTASLIVLAVLIVAGIVGLLGYLCSGPTFLGTLYVQLFALPHLFAALGEVLAAMFNAASD